MKINGKTFAGIGLGLLAGYFIFKKNSNKYFIIGGTGLAGGLLANFLFNQEKKKTITISYDNFVEDSDKEIFDEFEGDIPIQLVPTILPLSTSTSTKEMFDIDLGFTN